MPVSHFRRPLVVAAVLLTAFLAARPPAAGPPVSPRFSTVLRARVVSPLKEDLRGEKVVVQVLPAPSPRLLVFLPDGAGPPLRPGLLVELSGRLRRPRPARNPGDFDEASFLAKRGITGVMHAGGVTLLPEPEPAGWRLWSWAEGARRSFEESLRAALPEPQSRVAVGLALGYKGPLPREVNAAVQDAGVMHLLVPSGAKVAFVMLSVVGLAQRLRLRPAARALVAGAAGGFYTLMVGGDAPYARAFIGGCLLLAAPLLGRDPGPLQAIALSALLILLHEPLEAHSVGFQMTYAAVVGLAVGLPRLRAALPRRWPRWSREAACLAGIGLIVQAMLWPIFAQVFGKGSLVAPAANVLLVPYSSLLIGLSFGVWLCALAGGLAWPAAATIADVAGIAGPVLAGLLQRGVELFLAACRFFAAWPGAAVPLSPMTPAGLLCFYLAAGGMLVWPERRLRAALLTAAAGLYLGSELLERARRPALELLLLSLPRGQPALLSFAGSRHWLVASSAPPGPLLAALKAKGVDRLEAVVAGAETAGAESRRLERLLARLAERDVSVERVLRPKGPWKACLRDVCARFGEAGRPGPRVTRAGVRGAEAEYGIIALRLKSAAVLAALDGETVRIEAAQ